jgi:AcrR family transcriptional regulator
LAGTRQADRESRRGEFIAAAAKVFAEKSVANTAVSDIVKAAGVAQGTFYLYFPSKADIVNAVVELLADQMVEGIEQAVAAAGGGGVGKLLALRDAVLAIEEDSPARDLAEIYHRPENRAAHDRVADQMLLRLAPLVERIVRQGVDEGVFTVENPRVAAWFVLGGLHVLELAFRSPAEVSAAIVETTDCALRALGCTVPTTPAGAGQPSSGRRHGK